MLRETSIRHGIVPSPPLSHLPGYGMELVSNKYDPAKWERALTACKEALTAAEAAGYKLFDLEASEAKAAIDKVPLPFIPGKEEDTEENQSFKKRVQMFQYMITAHEGFNNKEIIWAINLDANGIDAGVTKSRLPNRLVKKRRFVGRRLSWDCTYLGGCKPFLYGKRSSSC